MTGTLIDLMSDMKVCLGLALGTGLISGYLYTKFRAREIFKPDIKNLKKKIKYNEKKVSGLLSQNSDVENVLESYSSKLHEQNLEVTKYKNEVSELEESLRSLEVEGANVKAQYKIKENVLNRYNNEIKGLQSTIGIDNATELKGFKSSIEKESIKIADTYKQKCDSCEGMYSEEKSLKKENSDLESKISSLEALLNKKGYELSDANKKVSTIREKLQAEFDKLLVSKEENEAKIGQFKKQLLTIKENLS